MESFLEVNAIFASCNDGYHEYQRLTLKLQVPEFSVYYLILRLMVETVREKKQNTFSWSSKNKKKILVATTQ